MSTGVGSSPTFDSVNWGSSNHYIKTEMNGIDMGTIQLMSVPYALYSANPGPQGPQGPIGLTGPPGNSFWQDIGNGDISTTITGNAAPTLPPASTTLSVKRGSERVPPWA